MSNFKYQISNVKYQMSNFKFQMSKSEAARRVGRWALVALWMGVIFAFSSRPGYTLPNYGGWDVIVKKGAHVTEYAILGFLTARAFYGSQNRNLQSHWFVVGLALVVVYALLDEYHQSFVPGRTASIFDSMIDIVGGLTALAVFRYHKRA